MEHWRAISNFPGYEVSNAGRVRRLAGVVRRQDGVKRFLPERILGPHSGGGNQRYRRVTLWKTGRQTVTYVHRLVARAFIGPCPEGLEVNHKNGLAHDNRIQNLEYLTSAENKQHFYLHHRGLISGENHWRAKLREVDVSAIRLLAKAGFPQAYVARLFDVRPSTVEKIVLNLRWRTA